jgi:crossover junction endodeoxyribonuclease RuvC
MRVFGIDCGTEITGYGCVECDDSAKLQRLFSLGAGGIRLPKKEPLAQRLALLYAELTALLAALKKSSIR